MNIPQLSWTDPVSGPQNINISLNVKKLLE